MISRLLSLVLASSFALGAAACDKMPWSKKNDPATDSTTVQAVTASPPAPTEPRPVLVDSGGRPLTFAPLVEASDPAVATVKSYVRRPGRQRFAKGLGTAFVYDANGYLLTNHHVVENAAGIIVGFRDGKELEATVVGSDKHTDVAVLKVNQANLPALALGDSDKLLVGDWVVAIGNPFGLAHTVSAGILSAKGRTRDDVAGLDDTGYFDFLQTDASINPGNSGGPLLNVRGEVVGINSAIRQNANSIGFAIPINMVKQLLPMLVSDGKIKRSALGVVVADLTPQQVERLASNANKKGAWVKVLRNGGPAEQGGIAVDDIIVQFNGQPVDGPNALRWYASIFGVGKEAIVRVVRGTREFDVKVTLTELDERPSN